MLTKSICGNCIFFICIQCWMYFCLFPLTTLVNYNSLRKRAQIIIAYYCRTPIISTDWFTLPSLLQSGMYHRGFLSGGRGGGEHIDQQRRAKFIIRSNKNFLCVVIYILLSATLFAKPSQSVTLYK